MKLLTLLSCALVFGISTGLAETKPSAPSSPEVRNARVVKPKVELKSLAGVKLPKGVKSWASVYPKCNDGKVPFVVSQKNGDFCCKQDAYGCQSWKTCDYYEGQCTGGGVVAGDPYNCTACSGGTEPGGAAEVQPASK